MKVQISVNDDLLKKVDEYCERNYSNRSAVFAQGANTLILQESIPYYLSEIAVAFKTISDKNEIDEDSKKKLEQFYQLSMILGGKK